MHVAGWWCEISATRFSRRGVSMDWHFRTAPVVVDGETYFVTIIYCWDSSDYDIQEIDHGEQDVTSTVSIELRERIGEAVDENLSEFVMSGFVEAG